MKSFQYYRQLDQMDCGPTCLRMIAKYYGRHYTAQNLREKAQMSKVGVSLLGISEAAEKIGFRTVGVRTTTEKLASEATLPAIVHWNQGHFVVLYAIKKRGIGKGFLQETLDRLRSSYSSFSLRVSMMLGLAIENPHAQRTTNVDSLFYIADPARGLVTYTSQEFEKHWLAPKINGKAVGVALLLEPTPQFYEEEDDKDKVASKTRGLFSMVGYIWQYRKLVTQLGVGMVVGSVIQLLFPFLTQSVVDVGISTQNLPFVYIVLIAQLALMVGRSAVEFIRSWILLHISVRVNLHILSEFLSKLMRLPLSFFDVKQFGDIMQRIGDHHRIESFLTGQILLVLLSLFNLLAFGFALAFYDLTIFGIALASSFLHSLWVILFLNQRRKLDINRFAVSSRNQSQIVQLIHGMQDIKLAGAENMKRWEWERTQARLFRWNVKNLALSQYQSAGALFINEGKNIFITFLAAKAVIDGQLTLGGMMSVQYILGQFNAPISQLVTFIQSWQDAQMSVERLNEVHGMNDEEGSSPFAIREWPEQYDIVMEGVSYCYPGAGHEPVLRDINLKIPFGKTTAIVGMSGSGKTTLLKLLLRFYEPLSGNIRLCGNSFEADSLERQTATGGLKLSFLSHSAWRQQCGVVMQDGFIFSDTIARNIAICDEVIDQEKLYQATHIANIHNFIESLPLGYHTRIGAEGNGISQGQKQRILIARAVYKDPKLLLFDEATNSLDSDNEAAILRNLTGFLKGRTVVVVAHRLSTVKNADQIIVMENGAIAEHGTHKTLIAKKGKYFKLVSAQLSLGGEN